jgi:NADPH-dependent curcumin reductase CurA
MRVGREVRLASRPVGWPTAENFEIATVEVDEPAPGQVLVRNLFMSVDPYMRGRMNEARSYAPPYQVGQAMHGRAVAEVVTSHSAGLDAGDVVVHDLGWREYATLDGAKVRKVEPGGAPPSAHLGPLGAPGLTAYVGLLDIAGLRPGDTVFVSGAAGAVGCVAGQIAKLRGAARVIGSAGSAAKVDLLTTKLGFDAAFNYRDATSADPADRSAGLRARLGELAPDGIDVYFDNVGGDHLEAALAVLKPYGRVALCGAISQYNNTAPAPGPNNLGLAVGKRLTLRGFIVTDHLDRMPAFLDEVGAAVAAGNIHCPESIVDGLENAPAAFLGLLRGDNTGKALVRLS